MESEARVHYSNSATLDESNQLPKSSGLNEVKVSIELDHRSCDLNCETIRRNNRGAVVPRDVSAD